MTFLLFLLLSICIFKWIYWKKKFKEEEYYLKIYEIKLEEEKNKKWKMKK